MGENPGLCVAFTRPPQPPVSGLSRPVGPAGTPRPGQGGHTWGLPSGSPCTVPCAQLDPASGEDLVLVGSECPQVPCALSERLTSHCPLQRPAWDTVRAHWLPTLPRGDRWSHTPTHCSVAPRGPFPTPHPALRLTLRERGLAQPPHSPGHVGISFLPGAAQSSAHQHGHAQDTHTPTEGLGDEAAETSGSYLRFPGGTSPAWAAVSLLGAAVPGRAAFLSERDAATFAPIQTGKSHRLSLLCPTGDAPRRRNQHEPPGCFGVHVSLSAFRKAEFRFQPPS